MKKSLLVFPLVALLSLTGCKKKALNPDDAYWHDDLRYGEKLTDEELERFKLDVIDAARSIKAYSVASKQVTASSIKEIVETSSKDVDYYTNAFVSDESGEKTTIENGIKWPEDSHEKKVTFVKDKTVIKNRNYEKGRYAETSLEYAGESSDKATEKLKELASSDFGSALPFNLSSLNKNNVGRLDKGNFEYITSSLSETYNYVSVGTETKVDHTINKSQSMFTFDKAGRLLSGYTYSSTEKTKDPDTGEYLDELMLTSENKAVYDFTYGDRGAYEVSDELNLGVYAKKDAVTIKTNISSSETYTSPISYNQSAKNENGDVNEGKGYAVFTLGGSEAKSMGTKVKVNLGFKSHTGDNLEDRTTDDLDYDLSGIFEEAGIAVKHSGSGDPYISVSVQTSFMIGFNYKIDSARRLSVSDVELVKVAPVA